MTSPPARFVAGPACRERRGGSRPVDGARLLAAALLLAPALTAAAPGRAQAPRTWHRHVAEGSWDEPSNWSPKVVPDGDDQVVRFRSSGPHGVSVPGSFRLDALEVRGSTVTLRGRDDAPDGISAKRVIVEPTRAREASLRVDALTVITEGLDVQGGTSVAVVGGKLQVGSATVGPGASLSAATGDFIPELVLGKLEIQGALGADEWSELEIRGGSVRLDEVKATGRSAVLLEGTDLGIGSRLVIERSLPDREGRLAASGSQLAFDVEARFVVTGGTVQLSAAEVKGSPWVRLEGADLVVREGQARVRQLELVRSDVEVTQAELVVDGAAVLLDSALTLADSAMSTRHLAIEEGRLRIDRGAACEVASGVSLDAWDRLEVLVTGEGSALRAGLSLEVDPFEGDELRDRGIVAVRVASGGHVEIGRECSVTPGGGLIVERGGTVSAERVVVAGTVSGSGGRIKGDVEVTGLLDPGSQGEAWSMLDAEQLAEPREHRVSSAPGEIGIDGGLTLGAGSSFHVDIGGLEPGRQHDIVRVAGRVQRDGDAWVFLSDAFAPAADQRFVVMTHESAAGQLDFRLPALPEGLAWAHEQTDADVALCIVAPAQVEAGCAGVRARRRLPPD